jgi:hypothetical protein
MLGLSSERYAYTWSWYLRFVNCIMSAVSFSCLLLFVSLFLALIRCLAVAIEMLMLNVCWNHIEGVEVWYVSP